MSETKPERAKTLGQWSAICQKSIREHLAPKGFAEIKAGVWKGAKKANIDFLSQETVDSAGKIAAGCVNHYRARVKEYYKNVITTKKLTLTTIEEERNALGFFKFSDRATKGKMIVELESEIDLLEEIIEELDYISIQ